MRSWRISELRQCLGFVRVCRDTLRSGDLPRFFRYYAMALRSLNLARSFGGATAVTATAGLSRILADLGDLFEAAVEPAPRVESYELVDEIAAAIAVLRTRDACDVTDEQARERARNIATALASRVEFVALPELATRKSIDVPCVSESETRGN